MKSFKLLFVALVVIYATPAVGGQTAEKLDWLFVQTASSLSLEGKQLILPNEREIFGFTDRPDRMHAYLNAYQFEDLWQTGDDNFSENPPNAVFTWTTSGEIYEAEIVLNDAKVSESGRSIVYNIQWEAGDVLPESGERVSLFVDMGMIRDGLSRTLP